MIRYALSAGLALLLCTVTILAADYKATVKSVDTDKNTITITITKKVDDKEVTEEKTIKVSKDAKITRDKKGTDTDVKDGLGNKMFTSKSLEKKAVTVAVTTEVKKEKVDDKEVDVEYATTIKVNPK
jgi:hypothetical protein